MNISEFAKGQGVAAKTLYRWIKDAGMDLGVLKDETGGLSPDGQAVLTMLCQTRGKSEKIVTKDSEKCENENVTIRAMRQVSELERLKEKLEQERTETDALKAQLNTAIAENAVLIRENEMLKQMFERAEADREAWKTQAERAQQLQMAQLQLLPPANNSGIRGFFSGLFRRKDAAHDE